MSYIELKKISHKWYVYVRTSVRLGVRVVHKNKYIGALRYVYNALKQHTLRKVFIQLLIKEVKQKRKNKSSKLLLTSIVQQPITSIVISQNNTQHYIVNLLKVYYGIK